MCVCVKESERVCVKNKNVIPPPRKKQLHTVAGLRTQVEVLFARSKNNVIRNRMILRAKIGQCIFFGLLVGLVCVCVFCFFGGGVVDVFLFLGGAWCVCSGARKKKGRCIFFWLLVGLVCVCVC